MIREASNIVVEVFDMSPALKQAAAQLSDRLKEKGYDALTMVGTLGFVRTKKGIYIVDSEGVIAKKPLSEKNRWPIDLYPCTKDDNGNTKKMELLPVAVMNISPEDIDSNDVPVKESMSLENFIKRFGQRLESNYAICLAHLRKAMK
jgi:hypothetical protein